MDQRLRELLNKLGKAIQETLSDSDQIAEAVSNLQDAGYDIILVLEASIGFQAKDPNQNPQHTAPSVQVTKNGEIIFNHKDEKFLKDMKISPDAK